MASSLFTSTILALGGEAVANVADTEEKVVLRLASTQIGSGESHARMICQDDENHVVASMSVVGTGTEEITIDQISGVLTVTVSCILGSCSVVLDRLAGGEKHGEGTATAAIEDLSVTTEKLALLAVEAGQLAALAVETAKIALLAVDTAQLAAGAVETAKIDAGAATLAKQDWAGLKVLSAVGNNGASSTLTLTGSLDTDRLVAAFSTPTAGTGPLIHHVIGTDFAAVIPLDDDVNQTLASDLSGDTIIFFLIPAAS